ncbi:hypothetical protein [Streptomyces sp. FxanaA7]|uniref:hypothetical protein n=1 Tax=Streptomyces sp. FxanaA7 TaxID=1265492 RepID=UPI0005EE2ACF|nr:hypothetical protein [Streptomyces sp. FxanaA7]
MSDQLDNVIPLFKEGPGERIKRDMAEQWEMAYMAAGLSLTMEEAAASLRVAVSFMSHLVRGHFETGAITEEQRDSLLWWLGTGTYAADEIPK